MGMKCLVDLDGVFVDGVFVEFPRARELWIPAFAGMTLRSSCVGMKCLVGLDGVFVKFPRARELWIPAFAGMTD